MNDAVAQKSEPANHARLIAAASSDSKRIELVADWILQAFDRFYAESLQIPWLAKMAFERRDHPATLALNKLRMSLYNTSIDTLGVDLKQAFPRLAENEPLWSDVEAIYMPRIDARGEADLAFAYINSARRKVYQGEWKPVEYGFGDGRLPFRQPPDSVYRSFDCRWPADANVIREVLQVADFSVPFRDLDEDAGLVAQRLNQLLSAERGAGLRAIDMVTGGFFRNRGVYLVGRLVLGRGEYRPFIVALLNEPRGIYATAVLYEVADVHNLFSSTFATFHVTNAHYHALSAFLHTIMPQRPLGLNYSTIGYHHVGKVAVMSELKKELIGTGVVLDTAPGFHGTVAIGFTAPNSAYVLKVIRDHPTDGYKWGAFKGVDSVLEKYKWVHEIDRTGSMLDNILYYNLKLDKSWFAPALLEELQRAASNALKVLDKAVVFKYLIVQRRLTPLTVFLENAPEDEAERAIVNLGYCIKNNAAANIFNKDYDARNYGVSRYRKVYLYDYDALEPFTEVKVRSNLDRCDGEEDIPDWYFEDGVIFLPEEVESGLRVPIRALRRRFRETHGDLMTTEYWIRLQESLLAGQVPGIRTYPESCDLVRPGSPTSSDKATE